MRNLVLVDAVISLREIARVIEEECGICRTTIEINRAADAVHEMSLRDNKNSTLTEQIINKAKE